MMFDFRHRFCFVIVLLGCFCFDINAFGIRNEKKMILSTLNDITSSTNDDVQKNSSIVYIDKVTSVNLEDSVAHFKGDTTSNSSQQIMNSTSDSDMVNATTEAPGINNNEVVQMSSTRSPCRFKVSEPKLNISSNSEEERKWTVVWRDDFDGCDGCLPSNESWIFDMGHSYPGGPDNWGNNEAQCYTADPDNVSTDGKGNLRITPLRDAEGQWTSARIETTRTNFRPTPGGIMAIEGRIRMPDVTGEAALGYWPAFWAVGGPHRGDYNNWPKIGEFDIMENVNGINSVWGVLHCGIYPAGPCNEPNGIGIRHPCPGNTCQSDFHTFRFEWDESTNPKEFRWYIDNDQYHKVTADRIDKESWESITNHSGYFLLLNVAMGGVFPNALNRFEETPTETTEPGHSLVVDYIAVFNSVG